MRGRTLNDAVVILDEAQNTTTQQIKMFLTRMGMNTKMIVTGDMTQIDLPHHNFRTGASTPHPERRERNQLHRAEQKRHRTPQTGYSDCGSLRKV